MKGIGIGPAGGLSMSRTLGTKVTLAGRTAFLPNDDVPVDQGTLIYCYSLNNPVTDARYSGQLPESSSLIA